MAVPGATPMSASSVPGSSEDVSMLVLVVDAAFATASEEAAFAATFPHLVVFANAFITMHHANVLVVIAAGEDGAQVVYPDPNAMLAAAPPRRDDSVANPRSSAAAAALAAAAKGGSSALPVERVHSASLATDIREGMEAFVASLGPPKGSGEWALSGALSLALCRINRVLVDRPALKPRILVVAAHADPATQYVAVMNAIFSAQKLAVAVDGCVLVDAHSLFLQQAAHLTAGVYVEPDGDTRDSLVQHLLTSFLADAYTRNHLAVPLLTTIDYRATCFCHRNIVSVGYVCSSCLSIFCSFALTCSTCGTKFEMPRASSSRRRRRRKRPAPLPAPTDAAVDMVIE